MNISNLLKYDVAISLGYSRYRAVRLYIRSALHYYGVNKWPVLGTGHLNVRIWIGEKEEPEKTV